MEVSGNKYSCGTTGSVKVRGEAGVSRDETGWKRPLRSQNAHPDLNDLPQSITDV